MDILYLLLVVTFVFTLIVQFKVSSTFNRFSHIGSGRGKTGAEVARRILDAHGLFDVGIERVHGHLTDHYDPRGRVLRLSESVYSSSSPSAVGVAAHEVGHAIQHAEKYAPIQFRTKLVPVVNFASSFSWIAIVIGMFITYSSTILGNYLVSFGILLFAATTLFHLVTLPCELNASRRALTELELSGWYSSEELGMSKKVLRAAAMTYVAALATSIIQLLRLIRIFGNRRD
ncbi:MAG: zinc metallopeptidase [Clostridia bacterium]|nr:zinc metallopeptidase [Clostridia bacterium]